MTRFCIDIPDAKAAAIIDAFCARHGYEEEVMADDGTPVANPQPKPVFFKNRVMEYIQSSARHAMVANVVENAETNGRKKIDEDTTW